MVLRMGQGLGAVSLRLASEKVEDEPAVSVAGETLVLKQRQSRV